MGGGGGGGGYLPISQVVTAPSSLGIQCQSPYMQIIDYALRVCLFVCCCVCQMKQWWRPLQRLKAAVFMFSAQVPDLEG